MKLEIHDTAKLKASLVCAARMDQRAYLNGVLIEVHARHMLLVSTDGHRLSIIRSRFIADTSDVGANFIIPREAIESFLKVCGRNSCATIDFDTKKEDEMDRVHFTISDSQGHKVEGKELKGKYSDWRSIMINTPRDSAKAPTVSFNAAYVGGFGKIAKILGNKSQAVTLTEYFNEKFIVNIGNDDFVGVLMGCSKFNEPDYSWAK